MKDTANYTFSNLGRKFLFFDEFCTSTDTGKIEYIDIKYIGLMPSLPEKPKKGLRSFFKSSKAIQNYLFIVYKSWPSSFLTSATLIAIEPEEYRLADQIVRHISELIHEREMADA